MKIIHISDLHFGKENNQVVTSLLQDILAYQPDVVVVSGDLTQRARKHQFIKAAHFLKQIPFPKVVVPGNHDVPLFDVTRRFLAPFNRYVRYINDDFFPTYKDNLVTIIGINTAYSFTWKSGRVTRNQLNVVADKFKNTGKSIKILVVHHPFHEIFSKKKHHNELIELGIDIVMSGHLHQSSAQILGNHVRRLTDKTLIVQAGTTTSTRLRGENNSYNIIEVNKASELSIIIKEYNHQQFVAKQHIQFKKHDDKWLLKKKAH